MVEKKSSTGEDIQKILLEECKKCTPFARSEASLICRFDLAMYIPQNHKFIVPLPENHKNHCYRLLKRWYCGDKWSEIKDKYGIPHEEKTEMWSKARESEEYKGWNDVPDFRYNGKEYFTENGFLKAVKDQCRCNPNDCKIYKDQIKREEKHREEYGFMHGLHLFEIKSDLDDHSRLLHQIPNMLSFGNYIWLVLGENQPIPEWLPPFISVLRFQEKKKTFKIERYYQIEIRQPATYWQVLKNQDIPVDINNDELYALERLVRKWKLNSLFHFQNQDYQVMDMGEDIQKLLKFLRRFDKKTEKDREKEFQKSLDEWQGGLNEQV